MINFEGSVIKSIYLGEAKIKKIYLGRNLIYPGYTNAEWITLSANLDTGIRVGSNTEIECRFSRDNTSSYLYRSDSSSSGSTNLTAYLATSNGAASNGNWRFGAERIAFITPVNTWITSKQNRHEVLFDGTRKGSYENVTTFTSTNNLIITPTHTKLKYIKVYNYATSELIADFIAVKEISSGHFGLFDKISGVFYGNENNTGN